MTLTPTYLTTNASELWLVRSGFDDLLLTGVTVDTAGNQYQLMAQAADATWGHPVPVDVAVQRWMTDGAVASTQGHENRELSFRVVVSAGTSTELAAGEQALARRAGSCLLKWTSSQGDGVAPTTVFEVWTWHLEQDLDVDMENRLSRAYQVTATAKPWARSENPTTVNAVTISTSPVVTSVDTCTSTTGWSAPWGGTVQTGGGAVFITTNIAYGSFGIKLKRTGTVSGLATTPYLQIDMSFSGASTTGLTTSVDIDGVVLSKVAQIGSVGYYQIPTGTTSFAALTVTGTGMSTAPIGLPQPVTLSVADVTVTDTVGGLSTLKQLTRSIDVGGSVPTSGSLKVASPSATTLGTCMIYTCPSLGLGTYNPPLRPYRVSGNTVTADTTCTSGAHEAFVNAGASVGPITYWVPAPSLPEATYAVVCRIQTGTAATLTVTALAGTGGFAGSQQVSSQMTTNGAGVMWGTVGTLHLPTQSLPLGSTVVSWLQISATATTGTHALDEVYLLDLTHGSVTMVAQTSPGFTRLWIDSPDADPDRNRPAVYIGTADDRSDAATPYAAAVMSIGDHDLNPLGSTIFTVTDGVDRSAVSAVFYRRWHTNAGS